MCVCVVGDRVGEGCLLAGVWHQDGWLVWGLFLLLISCVPGVNDLISPSLIFLFVKQGRL